MASNNPAAVDRAAARPPAATSAMTQLGKFAMKKWGQVFPCCIEVVVLVLANGYTNPNRIPWGNLSYYLSW